MIYIGADHRGFELKETIKSWLSDMGYKFEDVGASNYDKNDDYPDFGEMVGRKVVGNPGSRGILICGSNIGIAIAANKIKGVRAGGAVLPEQVKAAVNDDDMNILALGADYVSKDSAREIVKIFLETKFSPEERFVRRINKINNLEK